LVNECCNSLVSVLFVLVQNFGRPWFVHLVGFTLYFYTFHKLSQRFYYQHYADCHQNCTEHKRCSGKGYVIFITCKVVKNPGHKRWPDDGCKAYQTGKCPL